MRALAEELSPGSLTLGNWGSARSNSGNPVRCRGAEDGFSGLDRGRCEILRRRIFDITAGTTRLKGSCGCQAKVISKLSQKEVFTVDIDCPSCPVTAGYRIEDRGDSACHADCKLEANNVHHGLEICSSISSEPARAGARPYPSPPRQRVDQGISDRRDPVAARTDTPTGIRFAEAR